MRQQGQSSSQNKQSKLTTPQPAGDVADPSLEISSKLNVTKDTLTISAVLPSDKKSKKKKKNKKSKTPLNENINSTSVQSIDPSQSLGREDRKRFLTEQQQNQPHSARNDQKGTGLNTSDIKKIVEDKIKEVQIYERFAKKKSAQIETDFTKRARDIIPPEVLKEAPSLPQYISKMVLTAGGFDYQLGMVSLLEQNYDEAVAHYIAAVKKGYWPAFFQLGECCRNGWGIPQDLKKALTCYQEAFKKFHPTAALRIASLYSDGLKLVEDTPKATFYLACAKVFIESGLIEFNLLDIHADANALVEIASEAAHQKLLFTGDPNKFFSWLTNLCEGECKKLKAAGKVDFDDSLVENILRKWNNHLLVTSKEFQFFGFFIKANNGLEEGVKEKFHDLQSDILYNTKLQFPSLFIQNSQPEVETAIREIDQLLRRIEELRKQLEQLDGSTTTSRLQNSEWRFLGMYYNKFAANKAQLSLLLKSHLDPEKNESIPVDLSTKIDRLKGEAENLLQEVGYNQKQKAEAILNRLFFYIESEKISSKIKSKMEKLFIQLNQSCALLFKANSELSIDSPESYIRISKDIEQYKTEIYETTAAAQILLNTQEQPTKSKYSGKSDNQMKLNSSSSSSSSAESVSSSLPIDYKQIRIPKKPTPERPKVDLGLRSSLSAHMGSTSSASRHLFWQKPVLDSPQEQKTPKIDFSEIADKADWAARLLTEFGKQLGTAERFYASAAIIFYCAESLKGSTSHINVRQLRNNLAGHLECLVDFTAAQMEEAALEFLTTIIKANKDPYNRQEHFQKMKAPPLVRLMNWRPSEEWLGHLLDEKIKNIPFSGDFVIPSSELTGISEKQILLELVDSFRHSQKQLRMQLDFTSVSPKLQSDIWSEGDSMRHGKAFALLDELHSLWLSKVWAEKAESP